MPAPRNFDPNEIIRVLESTTSLVSAARVIGCSYPVFRNLCKFYKTADGTKTLYEAYKNQAQKGISKNGRALYGDNTIPTRDFLSGKVSISELTYNQFKNRLIRDEFLPAKCNGCGFKGKRDADGTAPLLLTFKDNNKKNIQLSNLKILCFNCYYLTKGNIVVNYDDIPGMNTFIFEESEHDYVGQDRSAEYDISKEYKSVIPEIEKEKTKTSYIARY